MANDFLEISPNLRIPHAELRFRFVRSSGPGGQNVNKVNSKAVLSWPFAASPSVNHGIKERLRTHYGSRINREGCLRLSSDRHRDQAQNVADCLAKLKAILAQVEKPPKRRIATRRTLGSTLRRRKAKQKRAQTKQSRSRPPLDE